MNKSIQITREQLFFSVFCIELLSRELKITGADAYKMLSEERNILDEYIIPFYDILHSESEAWIAADLIRILEEKGVVKK